MPSYLSQIVQLQERLNQEFVVRHALQKALSYRPFSHDTITDKSIPKVTPLNWIVISCLSMSFKDMQVCHWEKLKSKHLILSKLICHIITQKNFFYFLFVNPFSLFQDAKELIRDIAVLEMEVVYLEQYLLSLYRKTFDQRVSSLPTMDKRLKLAASTDEGMFSEFCRSDITSEKEYSVVQTSNLKPYENSFFNPPKEGNDIWGAQKLLDSGIHRSHSSLSQRSACSIRTSPQLKSLAKAVDSYHSLPLSMLEVT